MPSQNITQLIDEYNSLGINQQIDWEKFYLYSIITHSTAIEGSTVTEVEAQLLFDEGITSSKRTMVEQMMNLLQWEFDVIPSKVLKEDKAEYIQALVDAREKEDESLFTDFMIQLHGQHLENEIAQYKASTEMVDKGAFAQEMVDKALRGRENGRYFVIYER